MSLNLTYTHLIDGKNVTPPEGWPALQPMADFLKDESFETIGDIQPTIDLGELTFVNDAGTSFVNAAQTLIDISDGGATGTTTGHFINPTYRIEISDGNTTEVFFDGYLNMETYLKVSPVRVRIQAENFTDIISIDFRAKRVSFGFLENQGLIGQSDYVEVPFVVELVDDEDMLFALEVTITLLVIQLLQIAKDLAKDLANVAALTASGVTGPVGAVIFAIASAALTAAFFVFVAIQLIKLLAKIAEIIFPPRLFYKGVFLRVLLEKLAAFLGYNLVSPIEELDKVVCLPSNPSSEINVISSIIASVQGIPNLLSGIPRDADFGYFGSDLLNLCERLFNAKFAVLDDTDLHIRTESDPFWIENSTFIMKDVGDFDLSKLDMKSEEEQFNTIDNKASRLVNFLTDSSDQYTSIYFEGTNVEAIAQHETPPTDSRLSNLKGLDKIEIPLALGNGKYELSRAEETLLVVFQKIDELLAKSTFPIRTSTFITNRIGALRLSSKTHSVAKLLWMVPDGRGGFEIPENHRDLFSAKTLYEKYHVAKSFVADNFARQRQVTFDKEIPFTFSDYIKILNNSFFTTDTGEVGKIERLEWNPDADIANIDFWIEKVYDTNLIEVLVEGK